MTRMVAVILSREQYSIHSRHTSVFVGMVSLFQAIEADCDVLDED